MRSTCTPNSCTATSGVRQLKTKGAKKYRAVTASISSKSPNLIEPHVNRWARSFRCAPSACPTSVVEAIEIPIPRKQQMRSTVTLKIFAANATVPRGATRHVVKMKVPCNATASIAIGYEILTAFFKMFFVFLPTLTLNIIL